MRYPWFVSAGALCAATLVLLLPACSKKRRVPDLRNLPVAAGDASLVGTSPYAGEENVALSRETILRFDAPLDPASVHDGDVIVDAGGLRVPVRLHLGRDGKTLTLFWAQGRGPVGTDVVVTINGDALVSAQSGRPIDADGDGFTGGLTQLTFRTLDLTRVPGTDVCGRVFASEVDGDRSVPLQGVTIRVDGLETEAFATTDFLGSFCLRDLPAGVVFVHIDGSTATNRTPGFYYPNVGKAWHTVAGQRVNAGTVHLPAVAENTLQPVALDSAVEVRMVDEQLGRVLDPTLRERLANVALTVPADSLYADDGTRGGRVGIAPVAPDRLPGTLPPGLDLRLVITVQTDGASNFDVPAPICMPNLAHPKTGERLPAGAKSALWSFNHDTGRFEVVGPMTVSDDGEMVCTDPGVGIRAPGWHGAAPGSDGDVGPGSGPPSCDFCCEHSVWDITKQVGATIWAGMECTWRAVRVVGTFLGCQRDTVLCISSLTRYYVASKNIGPDATREQIELAKNALESEITDCRRAILRCEFELMQRTFDELIRCMELILAELDGWCQILRDCTTIVGKEAACAKATEFRGVRDGWRASRQRIDELRAKWEESESTAQRVLTWLCDRLSVTAGLTEEEVRELHRLLDVAAAALPSESDFALLAQDLSLTSDRTLTTMEGGAATVATIGSAAGEPLRGPTRFRLAFDGQDTRDAIFGTTNAQGRLRRNVPPQSGYVLSMYHVATRTLGTSVGTTGNNGARTRFNPPILSDTTGLPDADSDGLPDDVEFVLDTDPALADSDDDGMNDGDEVFAGRDPLDGVGGRAGVRSATDTAGPAIDIAAADGLAAVALGDAGVDMFNIYNGMAPERVARIDTPGAALRVACARAHVAVADGAEGLTILDVSVPEDTRIAHRLPLGDVRAVTVSGGVVWAGTASGQVSLVEITQGVRLGGANVPGAVVDVQVRGDVGYALTDAAVHVLRRRGLVLEVAATVQLGRSGCVRLFAGDDTLVATHWRGFVTLDLATDPLAPRILAATDTGQRGWRQLVLDGSGYGLGVVGLNTTPDGNDDVHVYDLRDPGTPGTFLRDFNNEGLGTAIPSAVVSYDGLAYLADRRGKLIVLRYLRRDLGRTRPELTFGTSLPEPRVEEGKLLALRARVRDDVQAQYVDFYVGDERVATDASYPFEHTFAAPARTQTPQLSVWARAWDTGGNDTVSERLTIDVQADTTAPEVIGRIPGPGGAAVAAVDRTVTATFSEPLAAYTVQPDALTLVHAGPDGALGTADDVPVVVREVVFQPELQLAVWALAEAMPPGALRATLRDSLRDTAGNALAPVSWDFTAYTGLVMTMYRSWSAADMEQFFAGRTPEQFTVYRAGAAPEARSATVVPNVHFNDGSGGWLTHAGANGVWETSNRSAPRGDDITFVSPGGSDAFAWLVRGTLNLPEAGEFTFRVDIDDQFVLEIDGQRIMGIASGCRVSSYTSAPIQLTAGVHTIRMSLADQCSCCAHGQLSGWGPGLPGGIIPAVRFGQ